MSQVLQEVIAANHAYVKTFGDRGQLALPPARKFAILTCMDARLDPAKYAGLAEGDAHVIRNAGGRASNDAIRSLIVSYKLLGTREWFVIHHTNCGMQLFTDRIMRNLLHHNLETAIFDGKEWQNVGAKAGADEGEFIDWLTFEDLTTSITVDVQRIRSHPLVPSNIPIYGYIYEVKTGHLIEVPAATAIGKSG
jgi:carbonic anhydrase